LGYLLPEQRRLVMGYYMRVFCTSEKIPTLAEVESEVKKVVAEARFETDDSRHEVPWEGFEYHYNPSNQPILVELNVNDAPDSMAAEEIEEFIGEMEDVDDGPDKAQVTAHLLAFFFFRKNDNLLEKPRQTY
jgi:hypothetical protein